VEVLYLYRAVENYCEKKYYPERMISSSIVRGLRITHTLENLHKAAWKGMVLSLFN